MTVRDGSSNAGYRWVPVEWYGKQTEEGKTRYENPLKEKEEFRRVRRDRPGIVDVPGLELDFDDLASL